MWQLNKIKLLDQSGNINILTQNIKIVMTNSFINNSDVNLQL